MDTSITDAGSADNRTRCGCAATPPRMPETAASVRSTGRVRCDADVSAGVRMYGWTPCGGSARVCRRESARVGRAVAVQGERKVRVLSWKACGVARSGARLRDLRGGILRDGFPGAAGAPALLIMGAARLHAGTWNVDGC